MRTGQDILLSPGHLNQQELMDGMAIMLVYTRAASLYAVTFAQHNGRESCDGEEVLAALKALAVHGLESTPAELVAQGLALTGSSISPPPVQARPDDGGNNTEPCTCEPCKKVREALENDAPWDAWCSAVTSDDAYKTILLNAILHTEGVMLRGELEDDDEEGDDEEGDDEEGDDEEGDDDK